MKILMATHYFASHRGGIEVVAGRLFEEFAARGEQVTWMAGDSTPPPEAPANARTCALRVANFVERKIGLPFPVPSPGALRQIAAEVAAADVVLLHDCLYLSNIAAFLLARRQGKPVLIVQHIGVVPYKNRVIAAIFRAANELVTRSMLRRASQVAFISQSTRAAFADVTFMREPEIVFNGVDAGMYRPCTAASKAMLRQRFGLPAERPVALFVGRFVEKKGLPVMRHLAALRPTYTWAFAGWGTLDPGTWHAENVRVFSGLQGDSMAELYSACDLLVLPSTGEGFPLVVQEALASGLPVVCGAETLTADPAMQQFVCGVPVCVGDDEFTAREFAAAIDEALAVEPMPGQRRAFALARYSWPGAAQRYLEIARSLLPQGAPRTAAPESSR